MSCKFHLKNLLVRKHSSCSMVIVLIAIFFGTRLSLLKIALAKEKERLLGVLIAFTMAIMQINVN